ncbi:flagellar hook-length control protein FliK [Kumtagia ephedrae]|uniref:Flagellar hook-length control protein-like C-terminal domain-containing protein n=1 Tax=Kumtagia ephedrae TaxID=2116701 RepID=A0A2P7SLT4_9HYPH|nr:flagellar hook-length control protein FliK [Mesorhizobium ephedrae]PSJ63345.1 hypothetical protein C7I84_06830 [Mesorhizobium ephedrae]
MRTTETLDARLPPPKPAHRAAALARGDGFRDLLEAGDAAKPEPRKATRADSEPSPAAGSGRQENTSLERRVARRDRADGSEPQDRTLPRDDLTTGWPMPAMSATPPSSQNVGVLADGIDQPRQSTDLRDEAAPAEPSAAEEGSSALPRPETGNTAIQQRQGDETVAGGPADTPRRTAARPSDSGETQSRQDLEQSGKTAPKDVPPIAAAVQAIASSTAVSAAAIPADVAAASTRHVRTTATRVTEPQSGRDGAAPEHRKGLERTGSLPTETRREILLVEGSASHNSTTADREPGQPSADPVPARSQPGRATFAAELTAAAANYTLPASREHGSDVSPAPSLQWSPVAMLAGRPPQATSPASLVASILAAEPSWQSAAVASATQSQAVHAYVSPRVLQIQLNPSRLGVVTATLRLSGAQLTIELAASSAEAREHLKGEEHVIEKAIRALGYDVGQVSVIQSSVVIATHSRTDITVSSGPARDQPSTDAGPSSGSGGQSNSRQGGDHGAERSGQAGGKLAADPGGGRGLYI